MGARRLQEITRETIISAIKANISSALADTRTDRGDALVTTEIPASYFRYAKPYGYRTPAVFVIVEGVEFRNAAKGANFIDAMVRVHVACLVEDKELDRLTIKADRYHDALHEVLAQTSLVDTANKVKLVVIVTRSDFSPEYENPDANQTFRKEIHFECEVEHYTNF